MECYKCHGTGYLPGFAHVAQGVCFHCKGSGQVPESNKKHIGYSRAFLNRFYKSDLFPEDQSAMTRIVPIGSIGHATAEKWILSDSEFMYIGQPVCRCSQWYKVPKEHWNEFMAHYEKVFKLKGSSFLNVPELAC